MSRHRRRKRRKTNPLKMGNRWKKTEIRKLRSGNVQTLNSRFSQRAMNHAAGVFDTSTIRPSLNSATRTRESFELSKRYARRLNSIAWGSRESDRSYLSAIF